MDYLKLTHTALSVDEITKLVSSEKCGAISIFVGTTRDNFEDKQVVHLEYEAYDEMALKVMKDLCHSIREKWREVQNIAIYHRLGIVPVLESSVVIAISSPHRVDAMAAVQYCIENLKGTVPIWKKEIYAGGSSGNNIGEWKENAECKWSQNELFAKVFEEYSYQNSIDPQLIQVNASNEEIEKRIQNFIERKREQINICNIQDFILSNDNHQISDAFSSCARVDAVLVKRKDSKGHLKVMKVMNEWGPQTKVEKVSNFKNEDPPGKCSSGVEERLKNAEKYINVAKPISADIYERLKNIENRILELESLSPEYIAFWMKNSANFNESDTSSGQLANKYMKYSSDDILRKINAMKRK